MDPEASVHDAHRYQTCSQTDCHVGAGEHLADFKVHLEPEAPEARVERYFSWYFIVLIPSVLLAAFAVMFLEQLRILFPARKQRERA